MSGVADVLHPGEGSGGEESRAAGHGEDQRKTDPGQGMMLPHAQQPSCRAERNEAEDGHDFGPAREVGAPLMLVKVIGNKTVPGRHGELETGEIERRAQYDEPGTILRQQQWKEYNRNPGQSLAYGAGPNERCAIGKPSQQLDGSDLGSRAE